MTHNTREVEELVETIAEWKDGRLALAEYVKQALHHQLQKAREEALARERQLKQIHMMELDAISCMSLEQYVIWRDHRKQRPVHSELDKTRGGRLFS